MAWLLKEVEGGMLDRTGEGPVAVWGQKRRTEYSNMTGERFGFLKIADKHENEDREENAEDLTGAMEIALSTAE